MAEKIITLNWEIPQTIHRGREQDDRFLIIKRSIKSEHDVKWKNAYIKIPTAVYEKYVKDGNDRIAFSFQEDFLLFMFNPPANIDAYQFTNKSRQIYNTEIINKIYEFFNLDKQQRTYLLKIEDFDTINGMELKKIIPCDPGTKEPIDS